MQWIVAIRRFPVNKSYIFKCWCRDCLFNLISTLSVGNVVGTHLWLIKMSAFNWTDMNLLLKLFHYTENQNGNSVKNVWSYSKLVPVFLESNLGMDGWILSICWQSSIVFYLYKGFFYTLLLNDPFVYWDHFDPLWPLCKLMVQM